MRPRALRRVTAIFPSPLLTVMVIITALATGMVLIGCRPPHAEIEEVHYVNYEGLHVVEKPDGTLTLDFEKADSSVEHMENIEIPAVDTEIFNQDGVVVKITAAGEAYYTRPITDGTRTLAVHPYGMVVRHEQVSTVNSYQVLFVDQSDGSVPYTAVIEEIAGQWYATFGPPVNQTVVVDRSIDIINQRTTYQIPDIPTAAGGGELWFTVQDADGSVVVMLYNKG